MESTGSCKAPAKEDLPPLPVTASSPREQGHRKRQDSFVTETEDVEQHHDEELAVALDSLRLSTQG